MEKNISAIIQARMNSTRLPKKIMKKILGKPVLILELERIKEMKTVDQIIIATTSTQESDRIEKIVRAYDKSIRIFRGSEEDVLDRYFKTARKFGAEIIVRITSDCPLIDPKISDLVVKAFVTNNCDYCCNIMPRTFPKGLDTEVFSLGTLEKAWTNGKTAYEKEHVTPYIQNHPDEFKLLNIENHIDLSNLRWTLDYQEDFEFISQIYCRLYHKMKIFYMDDVLDVLKKEPFLKKINEKYMSR